MTRRADWAYLAGILVGLAGLVIFGLLSLRIDKLGIDDFATIWAGPRAFVLGLDPYDSATWRDTAVRIGTAHVPDNAVYAYPPWVTVALAPLAFLSSREAGAVWSVAGIGAAIAAMRVLLRAYLPGLAWAHGLVGLLLLLSAPAAVTFVTGQWTYLFVAALASIVLWLRSGRPVPAGLAAAVMLAKPPLFVFAAAGLAVRALWPRAARRGGRTFVVAAAGAALAAVAVSWIVLPSWWPVWLGEVAAVQVGITPVTVATLFVATFGPNGGWLAPIFVLASVAVALRFDPRGDAWLPVWFALSSAAVIYANTYDALLLLVPTVLAAGALRPRSPRRAALVLLWSAFLLFAVGWYLHTTEVRLYAAVIPLGTFAVVVACLWPWRREAAPGLRGTAS